MNNFIFLAYSALCGAPPGRPAGASLGASDPVLGASNPMLGASDPTLGASDSAPGPPTAARNLRKAPLTPITSGGLFHIFISSSAYRLIYSSICRFISLLVYLFISLLAYLFISISL